MPKNIGFGRYRWEYRRKIFTENVLVLCIRQDTVGSARWEPLTPTHVVFESVAADVQAIKEEIRQNNLHYPSYKLDLVIQNGHYVLTKVVSITRRAPQDSDFAKDYLIDFLVRFPTNWDGSRTRRSNNGIA